MSAVDMGRVDTVLASAGTGKTTFLVREIARSIAAGLEPERILATTFTRKAATELGDRVRDRLAREGTQDQVLRLAGARIGTVNAVCGAICREFAFELGISPAAEVVDESVARALFFASAADAIAAFAPGLSALSEAFGSAELGVDWRDQLYGVIEIARANGIAPEDLGASADKSVAGLLDLLPPPANDEDLDADLKGEIERASALSSGRPLKATSRRAEETLQAAREMVSRGDPVPWPLWCRLGKPNAAKADEEVFAGLARAACRHPEHPRLRADLERFVRLVLSCAAQAMPAFRRAKDARAVLDFADQEALALAALSVPANREKLRERIGAVFVDEMQDSSPIQVALFTALARVVPRCVWVGDPKQSIFGFRSADPTLTLATALGAASDTGGDTRVLSTSWRSRPGICRLLNDCFGPAFERLGLTREQSAFSGSGRDELEGGESPVAVWYLDGKTKRNRADSIGSGIASALTDPEAWPVASGTCTRGLRPGDIAVLCRGNDDVEEVASALTRMGLDVAVERGALLDGIEGQLVMAAIRWVVDRSDRLALAELVRLSAEPDRRSAWLEALADTNPVAALTRELSFASTLDALRERLTSSTVGEIVDAVLVEGGIIDKVREWGDWPERMSSLEAMRGLASDYEGERRRAGVPETLGDFAGWAADRCAKRPGNLGRDAITVLTYHRSKGLEWPLVVCTGLDEGPRISLFQPAVEVDGDVDWRDPLANRWVRFWPWPYGAQTKDVPLDAAAREGAAGRRAARAAQEEAVRLLYVGMTRPRDHLVLATPVSREPVWLKVLDAGTSHVVFPGADEPSMMVAGESHSVRPRLATPEEHRGRRGPAPADLPISFRRSSHAPLRRSPSSHAPVSARIAGRAHMGSRIPVRGTPDMARLGDALHAFLASDRRGSDAALRRRRAEGHLVRWGVSGHLDAADVVGASDRLQDWIAARFPGARVRREAAIHAVDGNRTIVGRIDLLIEGEGWFVLVDHKSFPGRSATWDSRAKSHGAQLALYAEAVEIVTGRKCRGAYVHLPVAGAMIEVAAAVEPSQAKSLASAAVPRRRPRVTRPDTKRPVRAGDEHGRRIPAEDLPTSEAGRGRTGVR